MAHLSLQHIQKIYNNQVHVVKDFNLEIEDKEFIVFVGPSGCGKSTMLRMIAGLEEISGGELLINGVCMNDVPAKSRGIAMVFQNYALYPHMSVYDNMAFGLKMQKLDAKLRVQMRAEISKLHQKLNTTMIYVTHDQTEAMTMATRIVIMKDGIIQQVGAPKTVYNQPANMFVAGFIGSPSMNFIRGTLDKHDFVTETLKLAIPANKLSQETIDKYQHKPVILGIRPEDISPVPEQSIHSVISVAELTGAEFMLYTTVGGHELTLRANADADYYATQNINICFDMQKSHFFDDETEIALK